ncbi:hypothetical protein L1887_11533 [Cichorium endivia]|nr:hypothetical protein L1887_11533 [Cichorium endivia]
MNEIRAPLVDQDDKTRRIISWFAQALLLQFVVLLHLDDLYESPKKGLGGYHHHNAHISTATPSLNQPNLRLHGLPLPLLPPPDHHRHNNITRASITVVLASKK